MAARTEKLVRELLALYGKYGQAEFDRAIEEIRSGSTTLAFAHSVEQATRSFEDRGIRSVAPKRKAPTASARERFEDYQYRLMTAGTRQTPELPNLLQGIVDRTILPNPRALRDFAAMLDIPLTSNKIDRYSLARKIGDALLALPDEEATSRIKLAREIGAEPSSLQSWANIIVRR